VQDNSWRSSRRLLRVAASSNLFVIEVHKEEYLGQLRCMFSEHGLNLVQVNQRPLPLLGREQRENTNWWLVSDIGVRI